MEKINFEALPSTKTPINPTNLNLMQDNIEAEIGTKQDGIILNYSGDLNDAKKTGFMYATGLATNLPVANQAFYVTVIALSNNYVYQQAARGGTFETYERRCSGGTWTEWRKTNQPNITTGTEFKTGRIIDGKEEYGKIVDCGALPNATLKNVAHGLSNVTFTEIKGIARKSNASLPLPYTHATLANQVMIDITESNIRISTGVDASAFTETKVTLYYTKNS